MSLHLEREITALQASCTMDSTDEAEAAAAAAVGAFDMKLAEEFGERRPRLLRVVKSQIAGVRQAERLEIARGMVAARNAARDERIQAIRQARIAEDSARAKASREIRRAAKDDLAYRQMYQAALASAKEKLLMEIQAGHYSSNPHHPTPCHPTTYTHTPHPPSLHSVQAVAGAQKNIAETLEALNLKFDWAVVTDFAKEQAAVAMVEAQRIASGDTTHLLKASCTAGAVCSSVVGLLGVINPFNIFMPMRYLMDVYLAAFSLVALAFEFPHPRTAPVRKWVEKWMRALSRLTGRGVFYIFLGSLSFAQLWESGGLGYFFAFLMGGIEVFAGCLCVYEGVQTSVKMAKAREASAATAAARAASRRRRASARPSGRREQERDDGGGGARHLVQRPRRADRRRTGRARAQHDGCRPRGHRQRRRLLAWWASAKHGEHMLV